MTATLLILLLLLLLILFIIIIIIMMWVFPPNHYYYYYYYCTDRRIYLNLSKSTRSAVGLKALNPAANGCYLINVQIMTLPYYFRPDITEMVDWA